MRYGVKINRTSINNATRHTLVSIKFVNTVTIKEIIHAI